MGCSWCLDCPEHCPQQNEITPTTEFGKEAKMTKEFMCIVTEKSGEIDQLLEVPEFCNVIWRTS